jgi:hypothetical protein
MTIAGRLGMWRNPSSNIGNDAAEARDAGIITSQCRLSRKPSPSGCLKLHLHGFPPGVFHDSLDRRTAIVYITRRTANHRKAIVRARTVRIGRVGGNSLEETHDNLVDISSGSHGGGLGAYEIHV